MIHIITKEPTEELELSVKDERYCLIQRVQGSDGFVAKVIIMNKREALRLNQAISEEILKL